MVYKLNSTAYANLLKIDPKDGFQTKIKDLLDDSVVTLFNKLHSSRTDQYIANTYVSSMIRDAEKNLDKKEFKKLLIAMKKDVNPFYFSTFLNRGGSSDLAETRNVFNTFNNAQLSSLTPDIRIMIRTRYGPDKYEVDYIPIQQVKPEFNMLESPEKSGAVLGLKDITLDFAGEHPESADRDIKCTATFFGNSLSVFQKNKDYVKLIVPHFGNKKGVESNTIFQLGWNPPSKEARKSLEFTSTQFTALEEQFQTFIMQYTSHDFSFNVDGSFQLRVEYVSRIDNTMQEADFGQSISMLANVYGEPVENGIPLDPGTMQKIQNFIKMNHAGAPNDVKTLIVSKLSEGYGQSLPEGDPVELNIRRYHSKLEGLTEQKFLDLFDSIEYMKYEIPMTEINLRFLRIAIDKTFADAGIDPPSGKSLYDYVLRLTHPETGELNSGMFLTQEQMTILFLLKFSKGSKALSNHQTEIERSFGEARSPKILSPDEMEIKYGVDAIGSGMAQTFLGLNHLVNVTTVGKLIEAFIKSNSSVKTLLKERDVSIVLGTVKILNFGPKHGQIASLYHLPITEQSVKEIVRELYTSKLKSKITLTSFINAIMHVVKKNFTQGDLILDAGKLNTANSLRTVQMSVSRASRDRLASAPNSSTLKRGVRGDLRYLDITKLANLYCVNISPSLDTSLPIKEAALDNYVVGAANSVIKKVNYTQANTAVMQAKRDDNIVAAYRSGNALGVLPQLYNVKVDLVGNMRFIPGYFFNLLPNVMGMSLSAKDSIIRDLGLLGSYWTIKVSHNIGLSGFTTTLNAINVASQKYVDAAIAETSKRKKP